MWFYSCYVSTLPKTAKIVVIWAPFVCVIYTAQGYVFGRLDCFWTCRRRRRHRVASSGRRVAPCGHAKEFFLAEFCSASYHFEVIGVRS